MKRRTLLSAALGIGVITSGCLNVVGAEMEKE